MRKYKIIFILVSGKIELRSRIIEAINIEQAIFSMNNNSNDGYIDRENIVSIELVI